MGPGRLSDSSGVEFGVSWDCVSARSVDSLRRELLRNGELRDRCGFDPGKGAEAVASPWVYTRFLKLLFKFKDEIDGMFDRLVDEIKELVPDLGFSVAVDLKGVDSAGRPTKEKKSDGRRERDVNWGKKTYHGQEDGGQGWACALCDVGDGRGSHQREAPRTDAIVGEKSRPASHGPPFSKNEGHRK